MITESSSFSLTVEATRGSCPIGEAVGRENMKGGKIPVFACEGACIRGEIARVAANLVARESRFRRGCHGEVFTVPHSAMARWAETADRVVVIDGCFLHCHGRVMKRLVGDDRLVVFDALSHHGRYSDIFDIDGVPEEERAETAREVADWVLESMKTSAH
jgi:uncharacterized metal-binding protein